MKSRFVILMCLCMMLITSCSVNNYKLNFLEKKTSQQFLKIGQQSIAKRDFDKAIKSFMAINIMYPDSLEMEHSQFGIIMAYYESANYNSAIHATNNYLHLYPRGIYTDYVYYLKGLSILKKNRTVLQKIYMKHLENTDISDLYEAHVSFKELIEKFPNSKYVINAKQLIVYINNLLATHELNIAKFYLDRKAYVAVINRCNNILKQFMDTEQVKEAIKVKNLSYQMLKLDNQAYSDFKKFSSMGSDSND